MQSSTRAFSRGRKPRTATAILLALVSVTAQMVALAASTGWAPGLSAAKLPKATIAAQLIRGIGCGGVAAGHAACVAGAAVHAQPAVARVALPNGSKQCPASGPGASCAVGKGDPVDFGASSLPVGLSACPADPSKPVPNTPSACSTPAPTTPAPATAAPAAPSDPATSPEAAAQPDAQPASQPISRPTPPMAPATSKVTDPSKPQLQLSADKNVVAAGGATVLVATSGLAVDGTPWAVEIFDQTTKDLVGACSMGSQCSVAFAANAGLHTFVAFVAPPSAVMPATGIRLTSNPLDVRWLGVRIVTSSPPVVGPGHAITFTATASEDVTGTEYSIELWDTSTHQRLTYCTRGTTCSTSLIEPGAGDHVVAADLALASKTSPLPAVLAVSASITATWVSIALSANTTYPVQGGVVWLTATASADLTNTPWAIYIYTSDGKLVGTPCNAGSCTASIAVPGGKSPTFYATIARRVQAGDAESGPLSGVLSKVRANTVKADVEARSAAIAPVRIMWGVDSCKSFTQDPVGTTGLLPQVAWALGMPDFWGRYLTTTYNCPALSGTEIAAAHAQRMGILPIYDDFDCSAVNGYTAGYNYAMAASAAAAADGIPHGTGVAVDIEPPGDACPGAGSVDTGFIQGWYDVIVHFGYVPIFYGNSTSSSAFAQAWCTTVATRPEIANTSYVWSFEPSLLGTFSKASAPGYGPSQGGCAGFTLAWQFALSGGSDVDQDEATSQFPLWYP